MHKGERSGSEMSTFTDSMTGRIIRRLTNSQMEDKHSYYDISPWSPDGGYILFSTAYRKDCTIEQRDMLATDQGEVYVIDTTAYSITKVADRAYYNTHTGAFCLWHPRQNKVFFYRGRSDQVACVDVASRQIEQVITGTIRQLSPDGQKFAYASIDGSTDGSNDQQGGVYTMNADGSERQLIVTLKELYDLTPNKSEFSLSQMTIGNTKWHPSGQYMLVAMWVKTHPNDVQPWTSRYRRSIYVVSQDGTERRWLCYFGHHHNWVANGEQVLFSGYKRYESDGTRDEPRLYLIDFDGSNQRLVVDHPLGGHPIANSTGTHITTWDDQGVVLVDVAAQTIEYLASLKPDFDQTHKGTHPHCVWSPDGAQILYNSAQTGHSQLYLIDLDFSKN